MTQGEGERLTDPLPSVQPCCPVDSLPCLLHLGHALHTVLHSVELDRVTLIGTDEPPLGSVPEACTLPSVLKSCTGLLVLGDDVSQGRKEETIRLEGWVVELPGRKSRVEEDRGQPSGERSESASPACVRWTDQLLDRTPPLSIQLESLTGSAVPEEVGDCL